MLNKCSSELIEKCDAREQAVKGKDKLIKTPREQLNSFEDAYKQVIIAKGDELAKLRREIADLGERAERAEEVLRANVEVIGTLKEQMRGVVARQILKDNKFVE